MKVYHGSLCEIINPDLKHSRKSIDFGIGFYTTTMVEQAIRWSRRDTGHGIVNEYEFDESASSEMNIVRFESYSDEWLDFILKCRIGEDDTDYDIVVGNVANDRVFNTIELYVEGLIDRTETIKRLRIEEPNIQIAFRSEKAIERCLRFIGSRRT